MFKFIIISSFLMLISIIDIREKRIPNVLVFSFFLCLLCFDFENFYYQLPLKLLNGLFYFGLLFVVSCFTKGLGMGDAKLAAVIGYNAGFVQTSLTLLLASFLGMLYFLINKKNKIPFAPFIATGYFIVLFCTGDLINV